MDEFFNLRVVYNILTIHAIDNPYFLKKYFVYIFIVFIFIFLRIIFKILQWKIDTIYT